LSSGKTSQIWRVSGRLIDVDNKGVDVPKGAATVRRPSQEEYVLKGTEIELQRGCLN